MNEAATLVHDNNHECPEGYHPFTLDGSFNDALAPLYMKITDSGMSLALRLKKHHCNPMGICHGAVYMSLMDIALCAAVCHSAGLYTGMPTININLDYMAASKEGDWLFTEAETLKLTNTIGFSQGKVLAADGSVNVSASGHFKLPKDLANAEGVSVEELLKMFA
ncbi:hypothetical protein SIN8267_02444 [Sinobacterium norvegicum]|uniref:Thioesterase domain-containing protein n=1 Tax=Sinobacterium norvegicum TaxID=1641715 RepID=A0ABM9AGJ0_9GAMM|nr:PaaI family thioesterase [Sinobacterium norvegicum]CAH0992325.1 hypothetical protein SIN8267_02444 [Sinobacterium norvegicum]